MDPPWEQEKGRDGKLIGLKILWKQMEIMQKTVRVYHIGMS